MRKSLRIIDNISCAIVAIILLAAAILFIALDIECSYKYIGTGVGFDSTVVALAFESQIGKVISLSCVIIFYACMFLIVILPCEQSLKEKCGGTSNKVNQKCGGDKNQATDGKIAAVFVKVFQCCVLTGIITGLYFTVNMIHQGLFQGIKPSDMDFALFDTVVGWVNSNPFSRFMVVFMAHCTFIGFCCLKGCDEKKCKPSPEKLFIAMKNGDKKIIASQLCAIGIDTQLYNDAIKQAPRLEVKT